MDKSPIWNLKKWWKWWKMMKKEWQSNKTLKVTKMMKKWQIYKNKNIFKGRGKFNDLYSIYKEGVENLKFVFWGRKWEKAIRKVCVGV